MRLDKTFSLFGKGLFSRSFFQKLIRKGKVEVNGKAVLTPHAVVHAGARVSSQEIAAEETQEDRTIQRIPLQKIFEDGDILVIDKPAGVVSTSLPFFPAHRLDKDTSGILVLAKNRKALEHLQKQWKARRVWKEYIALVRGELPKKGYIDAPLTRSARHRKKIVVSPSPKSRSSRTLFERISIFSLKDYGKMTLMRVFPQTGRTHQIRVHFSAIHHPVIGDLLYGDPKVNKKFEAAFGLKRQFLHASKLTFTHPRTGKSLTLKCQLPSDLSFVLGSLGSAESCLSDS